MANQTKILRQARLLLGDIAETRWSDDKLLAWALEAQDELAVECDLFKKETTILLYRNQAVYSLPDDAIRLYNVYNGQNYPLDVMSISDFERRVGGVKQSNRYGRYSRSSYGHSSSSGSIGVVGLVGYNWREDTGETPQSILTDQLNPLELRVYPKPSSDPIHFTSNQDDGVIIGFTGFTPLEDVGFSGEGAAIDMVDQAFLRVVYTYKPDTLLAPAALDQALWTYVIGAATLADSIQTVDETKGAYYLKQWARMKRDYIHHLSDAGFKSDRFFHNSYLPYGGA